jgi:predicted NBD/HSP70 family sugar kinase
MEKRNGYMVGNPAILKKINMARVMHQLRFNGPASRAELSRRTGLDAKTLTNVSQTLLEKGLIGAQDTVVVGRGRPAEIISIQPDAALGIGVDLGAQQVTGVVIDLAGNVRAHFREEFDSPKDKKYLLKKTEGIVLKLVKSIDERLQKRIEAIGFCIPGFLDRGQGLVRESVNIEGFKNVPVGDIFQKQFQYPVILEESSRMMAMAELWFGKRTTESHFICVDLGVGIGMGIVHQGLLYRGAREKSGEIGHMVVEPGGKRCSCGMQGCLETVASGKALMKMADEIALAKYGITQTGAGGIYQAAMAGDVKARNLFEKAGRSIGIAVANVINLFDPDFVVLNGGLVRAGELMIKPLKETVATHCIAGDNCPVEVSELGELAGAMGAAMLPLRSYFEFEDIRF